jgi:hypothetical protein
MSRNRSDLRDKNPKLVRADFDPSKNPSKKSRLHFVGWTHCAEVAHNVDDEEDRPFLASHCEVAAFCIAGDWMAFGSFNQEFPNFAG